MRVLSWIVGVPATLILIAFAIANRHVVEVSFDPLSQQDPWASLAVPLWAVLFFGIFCGLVIGWIGAWLKQGKWRRAARAARRDLADSTRLQHEQTGKLVAQDQP